MDNDDLAKELRKQAKSSRVFILGAGFSAAAGVTMIGTLLDLAMRKFEVESPGLYERVER